MPSQTHGTARVAACATPAHLEGPRLGRGTEALLGLGHLALERSAQAEGLVSGARRRCGAHRLLRCWGIAVLERPLERPESLRWSKWRQ